MAARGTRARQAIPPEALAFGEDRSTWAYVPSGIPVWAMIGDLIACNWDVDRLIRESGGVVTLDDAQIARDYYLGHREEIDRKLDQIANA